MSLPRLNRQSAGFVVAQVLDAADLFGVAYDETSLPIMYGARYGWVVGSDGIPIFQTVTGTVGPYSYPVIWPGKTGTRKLAQLAPVFAAKITSPGKATPVKTPGTTDTSLDEVSVVGPDNAAAPAVGTYVLVLNGSDLHSQTPIAFAGGGAASKIYKVTGAPTGSTYPLQEYGYPGSVTPIGSATTGNELNGATLVPTNHWVEGTVRSDGNIWFSAPFGC